MMRRMTERPVRYALTLPTGGACADPRFLVGLAERAEAAGWDGVFLEDYVVLQGDPKAPTCDTWTALAAIAVRTSRVVIGTRVTPLARRRPWVVARQAATIDWLSGGRMVLGAGLGDVGEHVVRDASFTHFGEEGDPGRRAARLDEALEIIAGLWTGEPFEHHGEHFTVGPVTFLPRPLQHPRIPIWIGGGYPLRRATARAARWDGSMLYGADGASLAPDDVRAIRTAAGDRPYDVSVGVDRGDGLGATLDAERVRLGRLVAAGATWTAEYVPVGDAAAMQEAVERGPLRVERGTAGPRRGGRGLVRPSR
jgi:alkanesulfonate monooxygenase SsuD/methylene tetrahydromethanopterin reductase-like flavin-dependent oxidoreductase (luciferase family)